MLQLNTRYQRVAPNGDVSIVKINNIADLNYHQELANKGFVYEEVKSVEPSGGVCISCEG